MRILLDTHIYLWCVSDSRKLSKQTRQLITEAQEVYVSSASIWEIAIKVKLGKLRADIHELLDAISKSGYLELPVTALHAMNTSQLLDLHRDPFDRMLLSQAMTEPLRLLTADAKLKDYSDLVLLV